MNNKELVAETERNYSFLRESFPLFYHIFFYSLKYSVTESTTHNARKAFYRLQKSVRNRNLYKRAYVYNPLTCRKFSGGMIELNDFGDRFADLKVAVADCAEERDLRLVKNTVNVKHGWQGQKEILLGQTFSFEHLAFSTARLEQLLAGFAADGLTPKQLNDHTTISEIENILKSEIRWISGQLTKHKVRAIFLHDDQRPAPALLCAAARKSGVETVTVRHGYTGWSQAHSSSLPLNSDHFIVWSDFEASRIHDLYPDYRKRVHSFGFPGLQKPMDGQRLGPPPGGAKIITYICGPIWFMRERFGGDLRETLWDVRKAVEAGGCEFVLRLHWKDRRRMPDADAVRVVDEFRTTDGSILEDFQQSTAVAASYVSSALLEASAFGRQAINITEGGFEVPWADNVSIAQLTEHLNEERSELVDPINVFRKEDFKKFFLKLL